MRLGRESWLLVVVPSLVLIGAYALTRPSDVFGLEASPQGPTDEGCPADSGFRAVVAGAAAASNGKTPTVDPVRQTANGATGSDDPSAFWHSTVVDREGRPVVNARVAVYRRSRLRFDGDFAPDPSKDDLEYVYTDAFGRIAIRKDDAFFVDLVISAEGLGRRFLAGLEPIDPIVLPDAKTYEGRIVDAKGRPVVGAKVLVHDGVRQPLEAVTDADGAYRVQGAADRGALVEVRHAEYRQELRRVTEEGPTQVDMVLREGGVTGGRAVTAAGDQGQDQDGSATEVDGARPDGDATAVLYDRWTRTRERETPLSPDGDYQFSGLEPGRDYLVAASRGGFAGEVFVRGGDPAPPLVMSPTGALDVDVVNEDGVPLSGAVVTLMRGDGLPFEVGAHYTDGDGRATFLDLRAGVAVRAIVFHPAFGLAEGRTTTPSHDVATLRCALFPRVPFNGHVLGPNGAPLVRATVRVTRADDRNAPPLFTATDEFGRFDVAATAAGRVNLLVMAANFVSERAVRELGPQGAVDQLIVLNPGSPFAPR